MSINDIPQIVRSRERLDRLGSTPDNLNNPADSESPRHSIQGPNGEYYTPLPVINTSLLEKGEQSGHSVEIYKQGVCGIGICHPRWSQCLANLNVFVTSFGIAGIWATTLTSLMGSQVTSIERHLGISSSKSGLLLSSNEIGYLVAVILGSHLGKYTHIPRCLSMSGVVYGLTAVAMSFGRFVEPKVWQDMNAPDLQMNTSGETSSAYLCDLGLHNSRNSTNSSVTSSDVSGEGQDTTSTITWAFWLIMFSSVVGGAVKSYKLPLMTFYIERNVAHKDRSGILLGIAFTAMLFGPPIAMFMGGYISSLPVDLKETSLSNMDQRWIGAWWLGFIFVGLASITCSLPLMFFPRYIRPPSRQDVKEHVGERSFRDMLLDLPKSLGRIFRRPVFVLALVFACVEGFAFAGWFAFSQKYVETQFNKSAQEVSTITGALCLFSVVFGTFSGGFLTTKFKLEVRGCAIVTLAVAGTTILLDSLYLLFGCKNADVVGIARSRNSSMDMCGCSDEIFLVCGDNNVNYKSPCLAGCTSFSGTTYTNCTDINNGQASPGLCQLECNFFIPYMILLTVGFFLGTSSIVPGFMLTVRSIEPRDQSVASGVASFSQTCLGLLPSPIFFGKLIDSTCTLWSSGGSCMLYDRERFRLLYQGVSLALRLASVVIMSVVLWLACVQKKKDSYGLENKKKTTK